MYKNKVAQWAYEIIALFSGQIAVVYFTKRTTGTIRRMVCYWDATILEKYEDMDFDPFSRNLLPVWDIEKGDWRNISMNNVEKIVIDGTEFNYQAEQEAARDAVMIEKYDKLVTDGYAVAENLCLSYGLN